MWRGNEATAHTRALAFCFTILATMPIIKNQQLCGQAQYCRLFTRLVSDEAIREGFVAVRNVEPIIFFFMTVGTDHELRSWLMPDGRLLCEGRFLRVAGWLLEQQVFMTDRNTDVADMLLGDDLLCQCRNRQSIKSLMSRDMPLWVDDGLQRIFERYF